jgi:hypothetical protein
MSRNRGRPKPKLSDLSRAPLTFEEQETLSNSLSTKLHPITAAVLGATYVEHELELSLRKKINRKDDPTWKRLTSDVGPLGTLYQKIEMAYALKIIDERAREDLHTIRAVRNAFAHARRHFDFTHDLVASELKSAHCLRKEDKEALKPPVFNSPYQSAYIIVCLRTSIKLVKKRTGRRRIRTTTLAKLLMGTIDPKSIQAKRVLSRSRGPTPLDHLGILGGLFGLGGELLRKKDIEK